MTALLKKHYHWVIVAVCCGFSGVAAGLAVNCMGVFYLPVSRELGVGVGDISFYLTIMNITQGVLSPVVVRVMGRMPLRPMITVAAAVGTGCYLLMSLSTRVWHFYVIALFLGAANTFAGLIVGNVVIGNWFEQKMGTAMAVFMAVAGVIGAVLSPVFASLIESIGWRSVYRIAAAIEAALLLPAILLIRLHPSELGLKRYGEGKIPSGKGRKKLPALPEEQKFRMKSPATVLLYLITCLAAFSATISLHLSGYASSIDRSPAFGAALISAGMVGNIVTKLAAGVISDRLGAVRASVILLLFAGSGCLVLTFAGVPDLFLYAASFATGSFFAVTGVSILSLVRERFCAEEFAKIVAYMAIFRMALQAAAHSVIGYSFDIFGSYRPALILCAGFSLFGTAAAVVIGRMRFSR